VSAVASRKRGGEVVKLTVTILLNIREELRELNSRVGSIEQHLGTVAGHVGALDQHVGSLERRIDAFESTTARGFEAVTARLESLRDFSGERWRDHERRIRKLETRPASR
jgi:DNA anti-recombination protein RmuC